MDGVPFVLLICWIVTLVLSRRTAMLRLSHTIRVFVFLSVLGLLLPVVFYSSVFSSFIAPALDWSLFNKPQETLTLNPEQVVDDPTLWAERADRVKSAFKHAYSNYRIFAFPHDELMPLSRGWSDNFTGWGVTVFDSLDTMLLMDLHDEFDHALSLMDQTTFSMDENATLSVFETTIRYMGGLLSAHALTDNPLLLQKAQDLADLLTPAFNSRTGLPWPNFNTATAQFSGNYVSALADVASCQLEYAYLAHRTGKEKYFQRSAKIFKTLSQTVPRLFDMLPNRMNVLNGYPADGSYSMGGGADSGHEYLLKYFLLTSQEDDTSLYLYMRTVNQILTKLLYLSPERSLLYVTNIHNTGLPSHTLEQFSCFLPGLLALGVHSLLKSAFANAPGLRFPTQSQLLAAHDLTDLHMWAAVGLGETCWLMYADEPTGLGPEEVSMRAQLSRDGGVDIRSGIWIDALEEWRLGGRNGTPPGVEQKRPEPSSSRRDYAVKKAEYLLRPETIESMFYLWKVTGDVRWRQRGWVIFEALERETRNEVGYASLKSVEESPSTQIDEMPSYFLAETLKYLYLLFLDQDRVPLDMWVFNTEAHPLPIFNWTAWEKDKFGIAR